jgi:hypothetical protein
MEMSPTIGNLAAALCAAQAEMRGVFKDKKNPHYGNRYATLENVIDTARPALTKHGLAWTQAPGPLVDGAITVTTMLMHQSGEWMRSSMHMPIAKRDPQSTGSALTYAQRYSLMAILGLPPTDDDDAEQAHAPPPPAKKTSLQELNADVEKLGLDQPKRRVDPVAEDKIIETLVRSMAMCAEERDLKAWAGDNKAVIDGLSAEGRDRISKAYMRTRDDMRSAA